MIMLNWEHRVAYFERKFPDILKVTVYVEFQCNYYYYFILILDIQGTSGLEGPKGPKGQMGDQGRNPPKGEKVSVHLDSFFWQFCFETHSRDEKILI
jgi:hypothetical protein